MLSTRLFDGLKSSLGLGRGRAPRRPARNALAARRLRHEPLEDRRLLSVGPGWAFSLGDMGDDYARDVVVDASGVIPTIWNSGVDPKLAMAAPMCFISSEPGCDSIPSSTGTSQ